MAGMQDPFGLRGRVAVVTGAGSGIGRACAAALAGQGARVAILERDAGTMEEARAAIEGDGDECRAYACDVSDPASVARAAEAVARDLGPCDVLVNNAGMIRAGALATLSLEDWSGVLAVNLTGYFLCAQAFGAPMRERGRGALVHVASIGAHHATPITGAYSVAKAGVMMLSRQLAIEWGPDGVRSNAVNPGMILTPLSASMYDRPGLTEARAATIPAGRIGTPEDVAQAVLFLASDRAAYVTGDEITVDGGFVRNLMTLIPRAGYERQGAAS